MGTDTLEAGVRALAARLRQKPRITVVTGAGVSAASGIPTFRGSGHDLSSSRGQDPSDRWPSASVAYGRGSASGGRLRGPGGLWRNFKPEDLATPEAFDRNALLVWEWYAWRRELVRKARPNRAHEVLAAWSRRYPGFSLVTQNVDGLHERAGTEHVTRFHGSLWMLSCRDRCARSPKPGWEHAEPLTELPPRCPHCGGLARPGVVWFGEAIPAEALRAAAAAVDCDLFLTVGTSALVHPAAGLVVEAAERGALTVEVNPDATPASSRVDLVLAGPAEIVLDRVERELDRAS